MRVEGSVALVTGANRGLGRALVDALLQAGASRVYAASRKLGAAQAVASRHGTQVIPLELDITDPQHVESAAAFASDVTLLVNNAGVLDYVKPMTLDRSSLDLNFETNFHGTLSMTRRFAPVIQRNGGGSVVTVLSFLSLVSAPIFASYNASKAASWSMMMSLRPSLAAMGIDVVNVFPTTIATEMVAQLHKPKDTPEAVADAIVKGVAAGQEDIFPMAATSMLEAWRADQKAVERRFAAIA